tara:strand:+ start:133 stop:315 length:183 start_codon:yes stop_codon:yes gene_type:complete
VVVEELVEIVVVFLEVLVEEPVEVVEEHHLELLQVEQVIHLQLVLLKVMMVVTVQELLQL